MSFVLYEKNFHMLNLNVGSWLTSYFEYPYFFFFVYAEIFIFSKTPVGVPASVFM